MRWGKIYGIHIDLYIDIYNKKRSLNISKTNSTNKQ